MLIFQIIYPLYKKCKKKFKIVLLWEHMTLQREPAFSVGQLIYEYFILNQCLEDIGERLLHG